MNQYRVCRPGEIACHASSEEEAMQMAAALSMRAVNEGHHLDADKQQTASVWCQSEDKEPSTLVATFRRGREV